MKKRLTAFLALAMSCTTILSACGSTGSASSAASSSGSSSNTSGEVITLSCATKVTEDSFEGKTFQNFSDLAKKYSNGTLDIQIYPSEQLGDSTTVVNNVQLGTVDMYIEGSTFYSGYGVDVSFTTAPFLMTSYDKYLELVTGEFGDQQMQQMEAAGFKMLSTDRNWQRSPYYVTCSASPINTVDDLRAMKLCSADSAAFMNAMTALGVSTTVINYSECYMALQQGTVDAVNCPVSHVEYMAFWEVAPYVTYMNCYPQELWPVINQNTFNSLSKEQQDALIKAANDAAAQSNQELAAFTDEMIDRLKSKGAKFNMDFDCDAVSAELHDYYADQAAQGKLPETLSQFLGLI